MFVSGAVRRHRANPPARHPAFLLINQLDLLIHRAQNPPRRSRQRRAQWLEKANRPPRRPSMQRNLVAMAAAIAALFATAGSTLAAGEPVIGLITKTETNPFFVKMKEGAAAEAKAKNAKLLSGAGKADGDNAGQVTAMENMIAAGAKTILITPSDSKAIIPAIKKAQEKGVMIIALDSPTDPEE